MNYTFNESITRMEPSKTVALMYKAREMKAKGIDVISLGAGEPDFNTPQAASYAGVSAICANDTHYSDGYGIPALRSRLAQKLNEENGIKCTAENILVTPSAKYALYLAIRTLVNIGDEVIILDPSWVSYSQMVIAANATPVAVPLSYDNNYTITKEALEGAVTEKSRLLILCSPNNPTGRMLTQSEAEIVAKFADKHDLMVICDEIYEKLAYGHKHISLGSIPEIADRVVTVNGFSKFAAMTGWRVGYICANVQVLKKIYMLYNHTITCIPGFSQRAALAALDCTKELEVMRSSFQARRDYFVEQLNQLEGVSCHMPQGAFYCWVKIERDGMDSPALADYILQNARVVCVPGEAFGQGTDKCLRMSYACSQQELEEAIARFRKIF